MIRLRPLGTSLLLTLAAFAGCATCPGGRCGAFPDIEPAHDACCDRCGADGILPNGDPCYTCGPQLPNPFQGRPVCTYFKNLLTCAGGCQEVYWDEWLSDPPDDCDPCDAGARWTGDRCCPPRCNYLTGFWDNFHVRPAGRVIGLDACCPTDCGGACTDHAAHFGETADEAGEWHAPAPSAPRQRARRAAPPPQPLVPTPAQQPVEPDDLQPDQKAQQPRRIFRR